MITIRVTAKVAKRLKEPLAAKFQPSSGSFGDWYANLLVIQRQHVLLVVSEKTLLPLLIPAKDLASFPKRLPHALGEMLRRLGVSGSKIEPELAQMTSWSFAKTASRQVLGSMTDFANMLEAFMDDGAPLVKQALRLARSPCSPLGMDSPIEATAALFGVKVPPEVYKMDLVPVEGFH